MIGFEGQGFALSVLDFGFWRVRPCGFDRIVLMLKGAGRGRKQQAHTHTQTHVKVGFPLDRKGLGMLRWGGVGRRRAAYLNASFRAQADDHGPSSSLAKSRHWPL